MSRARDILRFSTGLCLPLLASVIVATAAVSPAAASDHRHRGGAAMPGMIPGVDVYIPNPDGQPPIAWSQGTAPPPPQGDYGGGFLQYLVTGNETRPAPHPRIPPPYYPQIAAPVGVRSPAIATYAAPVASGYGYPSYRYTAAAADPAPDAYAYAAPADPMAVQGEIDPAFRRQEVAYPGGQSPGTIVIDTASKFLYLIEGGGRALRYGIGVGRPGFLWAGAKTITRKSEWPDWTPPAEMLARRPDLPRHMEGGLANPLGARAMYLGSSLYRIHGTNEPNTIGTNVSSGCIRLLNEDVADLYARVRVGTRVLVM